MFKVYTKMKWVVQLMMFTAMTSAFVIERGSTSKLISNGVYDYHWRTGIPLAERIKEREAVMKRIIGGSPTDITAVPYQAGLITTVQYVYQSVCGGSLISDNVVLTAAHCYSDGVVTAQYMTVVLGSSLLFTGGTRIVTTNVIVNSEYNPSSYENDIAIVRIPSVTFTSLVQPIALPSGDEVNMDFTGFEAVASGFGVTSDDESINLLQTVSVVTVPVISNALCMASYGGFIQSQHLCTAGGGQRGTCGGDSGGPLALKLDSRRVLIGITSFGADSCEASFPSAFVRVTEFLPWISQMLE